MDSVPDAPVFLPEGLPSGVYRGGTWPATNRETFLNPQPIASRLIFALHTVTIAEGKTYVVSAADVEEMSTIPETGLQHRMEVMDEQAAEAAGEGAAEAHPDVKVYITGHLLDGRKLGIVTKYRPFCEVELPSEGGDDTAVRRWFEKEVVDSMAYSVKVPKGRVSVQFHYAPRFYGYVPESVENPCRRKQFLFAKVAFPNTAVMRKAASALRADYGRPLRLRSGPAPTFRVYEDGIDTIQKFIDSHKMVPSAWHVYEASSKVQPRRDREMLVDLEIEVADPRCISYLGKQPCADMADPSSVPSLLIAVLDCEMNSGSAQRMPSATTRSNAVIVVSVIYAFCGQVPEKLVGTAEYVEFERHAYVLSSVCEPIQGVVVHLFEDEFDMLACIRDDLFVHKKVDIVSGHNVIRFDMEYMASRIQMFGPDAARRFMRFGVLFMETLKLHSGDLSSSAYGSNRLSKLDGAGFVYVDTLLLCKTNHKLRQNTLNFAARHFLKDAAKFDMPYELIPEVAAGENASHWRKLVAYCVQDSLLVLRLLQKWDAIKDLVAQSRIMNIPFDANVQSGQMERVRDYVMRDAHGLEFGMVMNGVNVRGGKRDDASVHTSAVGGWVLENIQGLHDKPICTLDFASLYPSVQDAKNLCWSTVVEEGVVTAAHEAAGLKVETHVTATGTFRFVTNVPGVFPQSLRALRYERNLYKAAMKKHAYGTAGYQNADNAQKAIKIPMNSGYGTANCPRSKGGKMECIPLGTVTCHVGRELNQMAERFCKEVFGTVTIYGDTDSIMVYFPEPAEILSGTRLERLKYAMHMGELAEEKINVYLNATLNTTAVKTEFEKAYFPFLSAGKKTYAGLKFEPGDEKKADADLQTGGRIECKGIRTVRRDVPQFVAAMTETLLSLLFFKRDEDAFWDTVHTYAERLARNELPLESYVITAELKSGYGEKATLSAHAAVSYAREYNVRGSGFQDGDRVPFVFVEEADDRRTIRPPWLDADIAKVRSVAAAVMTYDDDCGDEDKAVEQFSCAPTGNSRFVSVDGDAVDDKKCKHARHPSELESHPDRNHVNVEHYMDCICTVLEQLMPQAYKEQAILREFGKAYKQHNQRVRGAANGMGLGRFVGGTAERLVSSLPVLTHKKPKAPAIVLTRTLGGGTRLVVEENKAKKKTPSRKAPSAAAGNVAKKQRSLRD